MKNNKTRYCEKCGQVMRQHIYSVGFNRFTGKETKYIRYVCPELDWDKLLLEPMFNIFSETYMGHYYFSEKLD